MTNKNSKIEDLLETLLMKKPSKYKYKEPIEVPCPVCRGLDSERCPACDGLGTIEQWRNRE